MPATLMRLDSLRAVSHRVLGLKLTAADGSLRSALLDTAAVSWDSPLVERVRAVDAAVRASLDRDEWCAAALLPV